MLRVTLLGNMGADPEVRYSQKGTQIASFSVAVNTTAAPVSRTPSGRSFTGASGSLPFSPSSSSGTGSSLTIRGYGGAPAKGSRAAPARARWPRTGP